MTEKIKRIYISAPITGMEDTADQRFNAAAKLAKEEGFIPVNPYQENRSFCQWGDAIVAGLRLLRKCDCILLCEGWQQSRGCRIEQQFAQGAGIEVYFEEALRQTDDVFCNKI